MTAEDKDKTRETTLTLVFVVNGREVVLDDVNQSWPLHTARSKAIERANATGRPPDDWEIRDEADHVLEPKRKIETFNFRSGAKLFLSPGIGAGG
jgi:hypothetical protein